MVARGEDGTPLPNGSLVLRMAYANRDAGDEGSAALAVAFELSSDDKEQTPVHLSVYEASLTTNRQAHALTGGQKDLVLKLPVSEVRELRLPPPASGQLDVEWVTAVKRNGNTWVPDTRAGAEGHCGITGLVRPPEFPKKTWKTVRVLLADIALKHDPVRL